MYLWWHLVSFCQVLHLVLWKTMPWTLLGSVDQTFAPDSQNDSPHVLASTQTPKVCPDVHLTKLLWHTSIHHNPHKSPLSPVASTSWQEQQWVCTSRSLGAFTLAGISGIQISVFASWSKSWDFYMCGHKNLTNYRDQHRAANRKKSCDYLGIGAIICIAADVWTLEQIILVFHIPSCQASVSKQLNKGKGYNSGLISGMHSSVHSQNYPARRLARYFRLSEQAQKISYFNRDWNLDLSCVWMRLIWQEQQQGLCISLIDTWSPSRLRFNSWAIT